MIAEAIKLLEFLKQQANALTAEEIHQKAFGGTPKGWKLMHTLELLGKLGTALIKEAGRYKIKPQPPPPQSAPRTVFRRKLPLGARLLNIQRHGRPRR